MKYFLLLAGFLGLFVAGYTATSVVTSCTAQAQICCGGEPCVAPWEGISTALAQVFALTELPAMAWAAGSLIIYYGAAMAIFTAKVLQKIGTVINHWIDWWDTLWYYNFSPALRDMTRQLSTVNADQARMIGMFTDAVERNRTLTKIREREAKSHSTQGPGENVCVAGTIMGGMVQAANFKRAYETAATADSLDRGGNRVDSPSSGGAAADLNARYKNYMDRYCDPNENGGTTQCTALGSAKAAGLDDRDVTGMIFQKDTIDVRNPEVKKTVDDLIANIAEPFAPDPLPLRTFGSSEGQEAFLARESYKAKRQVVYDALYHVVARRIPGSDMGAFLGPMREQAGIDVGQISDNPSHNEVMQVMSSERYRTGQYAVKQITEPENNARERVIQDAISVIQLSDTLDLMDRYSLLVAARTADSIRETAGMKNGGDAHNAAPVQ